MYISIIETVNSFLWPAQFLLKVIGLFFPSMACLVPWQQTLSYLCTHVSLQATLSLYCRWCFGLGCHEKVSSIHSYVLLTLPVRVQSHLQLYEAHEILLFLVIHCYKYNRSIWVFMWYILQKIRFRVCKKYDSHPRMNVFWTTFVQMYW